MNERLDLLDVITVLSFILQLENNDKLQKQTSNNEILKHLHDDVMTAIEDNRRLCSTIMEQNEEIIALLKGGKHET